jgi:hypothetical protein
MIAPLASDFKGPHTVPAPRVEAVARFHGTEIP